MTGPSDLSSRVRAAIEETMRIAQTVSDDEREWLFGTWADSVTVKDANIYVACGPYDCRMDEDHANHIVHNDPQTILRRCEADLRTLDRHQPDRPLQPNVWQGCTTCRHGDIYDGYTSVRWPCPDFLDRASAYGVPVEEAT